MHFFATRDDLLAMADHVERIAPLDYVCCGHQPAPHIVRLASARDIASLGAADRASAVACERWLVVPRGVPVQPREIRRVDSCKTYAIDQMENDESIVFSGGGLWRDAMLVHGRVSTIAPAPIARTMLRRFESYMRRRFESVNGYHVSAGAAALLDAGFRLCAAEQSPATHDLRRPS